MSERVPAPKIESDAYKKFTHTPLAELLPGIDMEGMKQNDDLLSLNVQVRENMIAADNASRMHYASNLETPFAVYLLRDLRELEHSDPEAFEKIKNTVSGKTLIDLAAGENIYGYEVARTLVSNAYIGVEAYNANRLSDTISHKVSLDGKSIPYSVVAEDILSFLKRLPNNMPGIAFMSSGTDGNIFQEYQYNENVVLEIERILAPGGAAIFFESVFPIDIDDEKMNISRGSDSFGFVHAIKK